MTIWTAANVKMLSVKEKLKMSYCQWFSGREKIEFVGCVTTTGVCN